MARSLVAVALFLAGCAAHLPAGQIPCVPPGLPPLSEWQAARDQVSITVDEAGRPTVVLRIDYQVQGQPLTAGWVDGAIAFVDALPEDPYAPLVVDEGMIAPDRRLRAPRAPACTWRRLDERT